MTDNLTPLGARRARRLQYVLLSGNRASDVLAPLHNSAFDLWQRSWRKTLGELGSDWQLRADDFTRQDLVTGLFDRGRAVGLLLHCYFDLGLDAVRGHSYLATYPPAVVEQLRERGARRVLSMEYLTLDHAWRKQKIGVPLAEILLGLGAMVARESGHPSMIVVTRNDRKVNEILYGYGARCLMPDLRKHNVSVDLVALDAEKIHFDRDEELRRWIEYFWARRVDSTGQFQNREAA